MRLPQTASGKALEIFAFTLLCWLLNPLSENESTFGALAKTALIGFLMLTLNIFLKDSAKTIAQSAPLRVARTTGITPDMLPLQSDIDRQSPEAELKLWGELANSGLFQPTPPTSPVHKAAQNASFSSNESNTSEVLENSELAAISPTSPRQ